MGMVLSIYLLRFGSQVHAPVRFRLTREYMIRNCNPIFKIYSSYTFISRFRTLNNNNLTTLPENLFTGMTRLKVL